MNIGILFGIITYLLWGFLPIYWKLLQDVPAGQILAHRIAWSFVMLLVVVLVNKQGKSLWEKATDRKMLGVFALASALIGTNWLIYIWAVNAGFIVETSLGYFINPLVNVLLGVLILKENIRPIQWVPIGLSTVGVLYLTIAYGSIPWISLTLAFLFGFYGLVKKTTILQPVEGLALETGLLFIPAVGWLVFSNYNHTGVFLHTGTSTNILLVGAGMVTITPLLLFSSAVKMIPLSLIGLLQYIAPTIQFLLGVLVYKEPFSGAQMIGFSIIWAALIFFTLESWVHNKNYPVK